MKFDEPILQTGETKIEALPVEPSVKDLLDKVLEQNKMILEQNAQIVSVLSRPMFYLETKKAG